MRLRIPEAMMWKYGAKCAKTPAGDDIAVWEHPTLPQPSKAQIVIDVAEYEIWKATSDAEMIQAGLDLDNEIVKPAGSPLKILKILRKLGKI